MEKIKLKEDEAFIEVKKQWMAEARQQKIDTLPDFIKKLVENYKHDYGTIVHAMTAGLIGVAEAIDKSEQGGITGFQAGCLMWGFVREWSFRDNKTGLQLIDFDQMLWPQYSYKFAKTISRETWEKLKDEAGKRLIEADAQQDKFEKDMVQYEADLKAFVEKYPDYEERKKHYDRLSMGTGDEWVAEEEKEASGFEFAPSEPCCPVTKDSPCYLHWSAIVNGVVPFGYRVVD